MFFNIILLTILGIWIILYLNNKKLIKSLPYLLMIFITPIYNILDQNVFVKVFGCGCVPFTQTNMFNIDFNANDLRALVYSILAISITVLGIFLSKKFESRKMKIIYVLTIGIVNILLAYTICQMYMWV